MVELVINSKRSWENKHSTVLKRGRGRQEAVAGGDSPSSIPDRQVWEMTAWMWAGNVKWNNPIWGTSWVLGKQRKQPEGENWLFTHPGSLAGCHCLVPGKSVGSKTPPMFQLHEYWGSISAKNCYSGQSPERWCLQELDSPLENICGGHNLCHWMNIRLSVMLLWVAWHLGRL